jgi:hypothetical protein
VDIYHGFKPTRGVGFLERVGTSGGCLLQAKQQPSGLSHARSRSQGAPDATRPVVMSRPLFSYKRYAEQEPLELSAAETAAAVALVLGPAAAAGLLGPDYSPLLVHDAAAITAELIPVKGSVQVRAGGSLWLVSHHLVDSLNENAIHSVSY